MTFVHVNVFANTFAFACKHVCLRVRTRLAWHAHALYVASWRYCTLNIKKSNTPKGEVIPTMCLQEACFDLSIIVDCPIRIGSGSPRVYTVSGSELIRIQPRFNASCKRGYTMGTTVPSVPAYQQLICACTEFSIYYGHHQR